MCLVLPCVNTQDLCWGDPLLPLWALQVVIGVGVVMGCSGYTQSLDSGYITRDKVKWADFKNISYSVKNIKFIF